MTHSRPPSETREFITTREFTTSHDTRAGVRTELVRVLGGSWRFEAGGAGLPIVGTRLATELPDKYPGDTVFAALGFGGEARLSLDRRVGSLSIGVAAHAGGLLPYGRSVGLRQHDVTLGVSLGIGR